MTARDKVKATSFALVVTALVAAAEPYADARVGLEWDGPPGAAVTARAERAEAPSLLWEWSDPALGVITVVAFSREARETPAWAAVSYADGRALIRIREVALAEEGLRKAGAADGCRVELGRPGEVPTLAREILFLKKGARLYAVSVTSPAGAPAVEAIAKRIINSVRITAAAGPVLPDGPPVKE